MTVMIIAVRIRSNLIARFVFAEKCCYQHSMCSAFFSSAVNQSKTSCLSVFERGKKLQRTRTSSQQSIPTVIVCKKKNEKMVVIWTV